MIGKRTQEALYVHRSAWSALPDELQALIRQAEDKTGYRGADVAKIWHNRCVVSLLDYPEFDTDPHPALKFRRTVDLCKGKFSQGKANKDNPPILHRKEEMVAPSYPGYRDWERQTVAEEACGLYPRGMLSKIGFRKVWQPMWEQAQPCLKRLGR
jgi:DNA phosphorothioation-associated putative methyltransferase